MPSARLLLLFNQPILPPDHPDAAAERDVLDSLDVVGRILDEAGYAVRRFGLAHDLQPLIDLLANDPPDAVFNLFEGLADRPFTESVAAGILDWFRVPYTGCPADTLTLARDKQRTKTLLRGAGLPTAPFFRVDELPVPPCPLKWPVIVKPAEQDASVGIEQDSVATEQAQLEERVRFVLDQYGSALVEQFIPGREFLVSMIEAPKEAGIQVLPLAEIAFTDPALWPIYTYTAKWAESSREFKAAPVRVPVEVSSDLFARLADVARKTWRLLQCRDFARVDLRVTPAGEPYILEVNPNPYIISITLTDALESLGRCYGEFVVQMAEAALARRDAGSAMVR